MSSLCFIIIASKHIGKLRITITDDKGKCSNYFPFRKDIIVYAYLLAIIPISRRGLNIYLFYKNITYRLTNTIMLWLNSRSYGGTGLLGSFIMIKI